jgi:hypothetical protein
MQSPETKVGGEEHGSDRGRTGGGIFFEGWNEETQRFEYSLGWRLKNSEGPDATVKPRS